MSYFVIYIIFSIITLAQAFYIRSMKSPCRANTRFIEPYEIFDVKAYNHDRFKLYVFDSLLLALISFSFLIWEGREIVLIIIICSMLVFGFIDFKLIKSIVRKHWNKDVEQPKWLKSN